MGAINRKYYFDTVRGALFSGHMTQPQVDGQTALLDYGEQVWWDDRWLAYLLATTYHETALDLQIATQIIFGGMADGDFTGVGLPKYINDSQTDFYNARKIVNGLDQASTIQGYAVKFLNAITHLAG